MQKALSFQTHFINAPCFPLVSIQIKLPKNDATGRSNGAIYTFELILPLYGLGTVVSAYLWKMRWSLEYEKAF